LLEERFENRFEAIESEINAFGEYAKSLYLTLIDFMTLKRLLTNDEKRYLIGGIERLSTPLRGHSEN
jgi:hypothetical protein